MFWLVALAMVLLALALVARVLLRPDTTALKAADLDLLVYKDQLAEVERDVARGVLGAADAEAARTEVARRILAADKRAQVESAPQGAGRRATLAGLALVAVVIVASVGLYYRLGLPGMEDQPLAARLEAAKALRDNRPDQETAEAAAPPVAVQVAADYAELVAQLRAVLKTRPDDADGHRLLANHEARLGNFIAARQAQQRVLAIEGEAAREADYTDLAEIMVLAAGGYVSPQAENALARAIRLNPKSPRARYYSGLTLAQNGRPDIAYAMWAGLLEEGPDDAPWVPLIRAQIGPVARAAGISVANQDAPGPTAQDVENAQDLSADERQEMIRGMVVGLAGRLAGEGGTAGEWARLIRAYGVLGETGKASATWNEAQGVFAQNADALALLREAAQAAEVSQ